MTYMPKNTVKRLFSNEEATIATLRLYAPEPWTLQEVAEHLRISREEVRQIELRLMRDMGLIEMGGNK